MARVSRTLLLHCGAGWDTPKMRAMGTLHKTPKLAQRVLHGLPLSGPLGQGLGLLHGHAWPGQRPEADLPGTGSALQLPELHAELGA